MRIKRDAQPLLPYVSHGKYIEKVLESFNMNDVANSLSIPLQPYVNLSKKRNAKRGCDNKFNQGCPISFGLWFFDVWNDCYKTRHCTSSGSLLAGSWLILSRHIGKSSSQLWDIWRGQKSKLPWYGNGYGNYMKFVALIWQVIKIHAKPLLMFLYLPVCNFTAFYIAENRYIIYDWGWIYCASKNFPRNHMTGTLLQYDWATWENTTFW